MTDDREAFWLHADSASGWRPGWLPPTDDWATERSSSCVALMSDGGRCYREGAAHGWCHFHFHRVNEWFASTHGEVIARAARLDDPAAFRFVVDGAQLADAHRVLEDANAQVYFLACGDAVKVGYSTNPVRRTVALRQQRNGAQRTLAPEGLDLSTAEIVGCIPGSLNTERRVHALLAEYRLVGEWFRITPTVIQAIDCLVFGAEAPRAIEAGLRDLLGPAGGGSNRRRNRTAA